MRTQTLGSKGRPDLADLARQYREHVEAGDEVAEEARRLGRGVALAARTEHKVAAHRKRGRNFGLNTRQLQVAMWKQTCSAIYSQLKNKDLWDKASHLQDSVNSGASLERALKIARACQQMAKREEGEVLTSQLSHLQKFQKEVTPPWIQTLLQQVPTLQRASLVGVPDPKLRLFELSSSAIHKRATECCSVFCGSKSSNVGATMDGYWEGLHETVDGRLRPGEEETPRHVKLDRTPCQEAGTCICQGPGLIHKQ